MVVGIGASAGGPDAFQDVLKGFTPDNQMALVLVQHFDPNDDSHLPDMLSKRTGARMRFAGDRMALRAGEVYLTPPQAELTVANGLLHLVPFDGPREQRQPIDRFFQSLALDRGADAVGVVLSGTGSDGTAGARAIREAGGVVFAQEPFEAKYDGMPRSVIDAVAPDLILSAGDMLSVVADYHSRRVGLEPVLVSDTAFIGRVSRHLRYRTGHDFQHYKPATFLRRLTIRMALLGMATPADYLRRLISNEAEAQRLFDDLLINVTSFSHDAIAVAERRQQVIAPPHGAAETVGTGDGAAWTDVLLRRHAPPYLIVDDRAQLTFASEKAAKFLSFRAGQPLLDLLRIIHPGLEPSVRRLLKLAPPTPGDSVCRPFFGRIDGASTSLMLTVETLEAGQRMLVLDPRIALDPGTAEEPSAEDAAYVHDLEDRLVAASQTVQSPVAELETSNEDLKSSSEAIMSLNEELQSANAELSSRNDELQGKLRELAEANADLTNFVHAANIATVFLDGNLRLRSYTPAAEAFFRFQHADIGREMTDMASSLDDDRIATLCREVLATQTPQTDEFTTSDGQTELIGRFQPYTDGQGDASGVVFTFNEVTELRRTAADLDAARREVQSSLDEIEEMYRVSPQAMALVDRDLRYLRVNAVLAAINGIPIPDHYGRRLRDVVPNLGDAVTEPARRVFATGNAILNGEIEGTTAADPDRTHIWNVDWYPLRRDGEIYAVGIHVRDVSHQKQTERELRRLMRELEHRVKNMLANVTALVARAGRADGPKEVVLATLAARISALANTHNLLTATNWASTEIHDLLAPELVDVYGTDRIHMRGPNIRLNARGSLALGMTIHELATNAAKYGALSVSNGQVEISWARTDEGEGEMLVVNWIEHGATSPKMQMAGGFGTKLMASAIEGSLEGRLYRDVAADGVRYRFDIPYEKATLIDYDPAVHVF